MLLNSSEIFGTPKYMLMDPIHGSIDFFSFERDIIDHPLFQRLRHIKQNDILHFVFPGATHSRFEHCIGTMHVAGKIFKNLLRNYLVDRNELELHEKQIDSIQYFYGCLRIAALLHDTGHFPFSHQFEESDFGKKILSDKDILSTIIDNDNIFENTPDTLSHEHFSILIASRIIEELSDVISPIFYKEDIIGMMEKADTTPSPKFIENSKIILKFFSRVPEKIDQCPDILIGQTIRKLFKDIISGEIDADKMDYLLRDTYFTGCKYGTYNIDHLIKNICIGFDIRKDPRDSWVGIALKNKGLGSFEDFVHSRFRMYLQVYNHKTVVGFKWLIRNAISEILNIKKYNDIFIASLKNLDCFQLLTDTYFWECFRNFSTSNPDSACTYIINRIKLNHIEVMGEKAPFVKYKKRHELEEKLNIKLIQDECSARFSKITPDYEQIRLLSKNKITNKYELDSIIENSTFFENFKDIYETHFYEQPPFVRKESLE